MSPRQNKTPPISQKVCTKMVEKCSVNTSPIMAFIPHEKQKKNLSAFAEKNVIFRNFAC